MYEENNGQGFRNCMDEAIIKLVGKITLAFPDTFSNLDTQRELKATLDEALYRYDIVSKCTDLLVSDLDEKITLYLGVRKLEGIASSTLANYNRILHHFASCFQTKTISMITTMDIRYFLMMYKQNREVKESTLNSIIFCLKKFFTWLYENEIIMKDICKQIKITKLPKRLKKIMSNEQMELLKDNCEDIREQALIYFALTTGCRVSEISKANISEIDWNEKSINIIGKGDKERKVYFTTKTKMLLQKYIKEREEFKETNALFIGEKFPHRRVSSRALQLIFSNIRKRAGLENCDFITIHGCRRKFATMEISHNVKLEHIQKLLGHESPETTLRYAQISDDNLKHIYETSMM